MSKDYRSLAKFSGCNSQGWSGGQSLRFKKKKKTSKFTRINEGTLKFLWHLKWIKEKERSPVKEKAPSPKQRVINCSFCWFLTQLKIMFDLFYFIFFLFFFPCQNQRFQHKGWFLIILSTPPPWLINWKVDDLLLLWLFHQLWVSNCCPCS